MKADRTRIILELPYKQNQQLRLVRAKTGISVSEQIRDAIDQKLRRDAR